MNENEYEYDSLNMNPGITDESVEPLTMLLKSSHINDLESVEY
jgi:hypothetical protein